MGTRRVDSCPFSRCFGFGNGGFVHLLHGASGCEALKDVSLQVLYEPLCPSVSRCTWPSHRPPSPLGTRWGQRHGASAAEPGGNSGPLCVAAESSRPSSRWPRPGLARRAEGMVLLRAFVFPGSSFLESGRRGGGNTDPGCGNTAGRFHCPPLKRGLVSRRRSGRGSRCPSGRTVGLMPPFGAVVTWLKQQQGAPASSQARVQGGCV